MNKFIGYTAIALLLIIIRLTFVPFLELGGVIPDFLLILVVVIALREGQIAGTIAGFLIGLTGDFAASDFLGLGALTKAIAGFISGYYFNETQIFQRLGTYRFIWIVTFVSVAHNIVYFTLFLQGANIGLFETVLRYIFGSTLYTLLFAFIPFIKYKYRYKSTEHSLE